MSDIKQLLNLSGYFPGKNLTMTAPVCCACLLTQQDKGHNCMLLYIIATCKCVFGAIWPRLCWCAKKKCISMRPGLFSWHSIRLLIRMPWVQALPLATSRKTETLFYFFLSRGFKLILASLWICCTGYTIQEHWMAFVWWKVLV